MTEHSATEDPQARDTLPGAIRVRVTYERVGVHGGRGGRPAPDPVILHVTGADDLAEQIRRDVGRYLVSRDVEVDLDLTTCLGQVISGFRAAGTLTLEFLDGGVLS